MTIVDHQYRKLVNEILTYGWSNKGQEVRAKYETDGAPAYTKAINGYQVKFPENTFVMQTSRRNIPKKASINEIVFWFWQWRSNKIEDAHELGIKYWDNWAMESTQSIFSGEKYKHIGKSYGYQLRKQMTTRTATHEQVKAFDEQHNSPFAEYAAEENEVYLDQVDAILWDLKFNPHSRRIMFSYFNRGDETRKALQECAWAGNFYVRGEYLDFVLIQRSADVAVGVSSNWIGYSALQHAIAHVTGYKVGTFTHQIGNAHIYDRHEEDIQKQVVEHRELSNEAPSLSITNDTTDFYALTPDDFVINNSYVSDKVYRYEIAE